MIAAPDCLVCMFRQALNTARVATDDPLVHHRILVRLAQALPGLSLDQSPAAVSQIVYTIVAEETGNNDPYTAIKARTNAAALAMVPELMELLERSEDRLDIALHLAVAGNIIDLGIGHGFDIERDVRRIVHQPFAINDSAAFREDLYRAERVLYIGDNAGEIVFDRLLVEEILSHRVAVTFAVKSGAIINDATMEDAEACGLATLVPVIETGTNDIGVAWPRISAEFGRAVAAADLIVAKGHGNFETCHGRHENFYFLLKAKCDLVARELKVRNGDIVFKHEPAHAAP